MSKHRTNKVFEIDYLINEDLTEEDLFYIFETPSLVHSLVIGMFEQINTKLTKNEIFQICKKDNWMEEYFWSEKQRANYFDKLSKIAKNVYQYSDDLCVNWANWFLFKYGFMIIQSKKKKRKK